MAAFSDGENGAENHEEGAEPEEVDVGENDGFHDDEFVGSFFVDDDFGVSVFGVYFREIEFYAEAVEGDGDGKEAVSANDEDGLDDGFVLVEIYEFQAGTDCDVGWGEFQFCFVGTFVYGSENKEAFD